MISMVCDPEPINNSMEIIYAAENKINGKCYIGRTVKSLKARRSEHYSRAKTQEEHNYPFINAVRKYDENDQNWVVIEEVNRENIAEREVFWITQLKPAYNSTAGGEGGKMGYKVPDAEKDKIRNSNYHKAKAKSVACWDGDKLVKIYPSLSEAAKDVKVGRRAIQQVLDPNKPKNVSSAGFSWTYFDKQS